MEVMLHLGTTEVVARVSIKGQTLEPGQQAYADLRLREPVVATWGQRFIVRRISPAMTLGGGRILDPCVEDASSNRIRDLDAVCQPLASSSAIERLSACLSRCENVRDLELPIVRATGIDSAEVPNLLMQLREQQELVCLGQREQRVELHITRLTHLVKVMARTIREEVLKHQPRRSLPKPMLLTACRDIAAAPLLELLIDQLIIQKKLVQIGENLGPADLQVRLTKQQRQLYDSLWRQLSNGGLTPPTFKEMVQASNQQPADVERLLSLMIEGCLIIRAGDDVYFTRAAIESARVICCELFAASGLASMGQLRDAWGVTRKFAIPLCECLDELGITTRAGDLRIPGLRLDVPLIDQPSQS
jgi:selenocysteine-specific elongation factor